MGGPPFFSPKFLGFGGPIRGFPPPFYTLAFFGPGAPFSPPNFRLTPPYFGGGPPKFLFPPFLRGKGVQKPLFWDSPFLKVGGPPLGPPFLKFFNLRGPPGGPSRGGRGEGEKFFPSFSLGILGKTLFKKPFF